MLSLVAANCRPGSMEPVDFTLQCGWWAALAYGLVLTGITQMTSNENRHFQRKRKRQRFRDPAAAQADFTLPLPGQVGSRQPFFVGTASRLGHELKQALEDAIPGKSQSAISVGGV